MGWYQLATAAGTVASTAAALASRSPGRHASAAEELLLRRQQLNERERTLRVRELSIAQRELALSLRERALAQREDALQREKPHGRGYLETGQSAPALTRYLDEAHTELAEQHRQYTELEADYRDLLAAHNALVVQVLNDNAQRFAPTDSHLEPGCPSRPPSPLALVRTLQRQNPA